MASTNILTIKQKILEKQLDNIQENIDIKSRLIELNEEAELNKNDSIKSILGFSIYAMFNILFFSLYFLNQISSNTLYSLCLISFVLAVGIYYYDKYNITKKLKHYNKVFEKDLLKAGDTVKNELDDASQQQCNCEEYYNLSPYVHLDH